MEPVEHVIIILDVPLVLWMIPLPGHLHVCCSCVTFEKHVLLLDVIIFDAKNNKKAIASRTWSRRTGVAAACVRCPSWSCHFLVFLGCVRRHCPPPLLLLHKKPFFLFCTYILPKRSLLEAAAPPPPPTKTATPRMLQFSRGAVSHPYRMPATPAANQTVQIFPVHNG